MGRRRNVCQEEALIARRILFDLADHRAERLFLAQAPGNTLTLTCPGHDVRIVHLIDPALVEELAEARVVKQGREEHGTGVAVVVEHLENALHVDPLQGEHVEIPDRIEPSKGGKLRLDRTGIAGKEVWEELHPVRSEEHTSELQSPCNLVCRLL